MKKIILLLAMLTAFVNLNAQSTIFEDSFESYTDFAITGVGNWTLTDVDLGATGGVGTSVYPNKLVPQAFQVFNSTTTTPALVASASSNWSARTGVKNMVCKYKSTAPRVNDDWMISPQVTLGTSNTVTFWGKACSGVAIETSEKFDVWISSTNTLIPSFVKISGATVITTIAPGATWREYMFTIPVSYNNVPVYIGIHCVSEDQYGFAVDDFKVTGTVACAAPQNGTAVVTALSADLSWTGVGPLDAVEVKVQLAGAGTPAIANNTGVAANGTTYTASPLIINTNYEFWVRSECSDGVLFSLWSGPYLFNTNQAPNCVTLVSPTNAATAVSATTPIVLSWTAATTGGVATSYDVFIDTNVAPTTLVGNFTALNATGPILSAFTTYYWKVIAKNAAGAAVGCTIVYSFTTGPNAFSPYCGPVVYTNALEPITYVNFAGINKTYPNTVVPAATAVFHKIFTDVATVSQGGTFPISLKGMTDLAFTNRFIVYIDWNQNGVLNDAGEVYFETPELTIFDSTGLPAVAPVVGNIIVPATATLGNTRMRIKKQFGGASLGSLPCVGLAYGEIHDYNVSVGVLATDTFTATNFKSFPNPVKDILNLSYDKNITAVSVINLLGQEVLSTKVNNTDAKIDMSGLTAGAYMVKVSSDNEVKTIKVIKE